MIMMTLGKGVGVYLRSIITNNVGVDDKHGQFPRPSLVIRLLAAQLSALQ